MDAFGWPPPRYVSDLDQVPEDLRFMYEENGAGWELRQRVMMRLGAHKRQLLKALKQARRTSPSNERRVREAMILGFVDRLRHSARRLPR